MYILLSNTDLLFLKASCAREIQERKKGQARKKMMRVFKGRCYAQKYDQFTYKAEVKIVAGKHSGVSAFVIGETPHKVHVCLPSGNTSTLYKADVRSLVDK